MALSRQAADPCSGAGATGVDLSDGGIAHPRCRSGGRGPRGGQGIWAGGGSSNGGGGRDVGCSDVLRRNWDRSGGSYEAAGSLQLPVRESLGMLVSLHGLNMSYNNFMGQIPSPLSELSRLESLDLSWNQLSGEIPQDLTCLTSLECLNLSYNNLSGRIPWDNQFLSFPNSSFEGNLGLCGLPLSKQCGTPATIAPSTVPPPESNSLCLDKLGVILLFAFVGLGFGVGFALSLMLRLFCRTEGWLCKHG